MKTVDFTDFSLAPENRIGHNALEGARGEAQG